MSVDAVVQTGSLTNDEQELLARVKNGLPLVADLARADALIGIREGNTVRVLAHAKPHSIAPVYTHSLTGEALGREGHPNVWESLEHNRYSRRMRDIYRDMMAWNSSCACGLSARASSRLSAMNFSANAFSLPRGLVWPRAAVNKSIR